VGAASTTSWESVLDIDDDYADEVEARLTPEVIEGLQRAAAY
jgi:hypothetical protein